MPFQEYRQFIDLCDKSTLEDKAKISKFYLHNFAWIDLNVWDPNAKLGDLQMMDLASWMGHEKARAEEVKIIVEKEEREPLYNKAEQINPMSISSNHNIVSNDAQLAPRYLATQEHTISNFDNTLRFLGSESHQACQRIWRNLPHYLRMREVDKCIGNDPPV